MNIFKTIYPTERLTTSLILASTLSFLLNNPTYAIKELEEVNLNEHRTNYNSLPSVEESNKELLRSQQFQPFLKDAEEIVTRYELESLVGFRLIHRHFSLDAEQVMAENFQILDNIPSLVTSAHILETAIDMGAKPASWIFSAYTQQDPFLFETSTDSSVKSTLSALEKSPEFFDEMGNLLREYHLNDLLSVAALKRNSLVAQEGQIYREVNFGQEQRSVVQLWNEHDRSQPYMRTSWSFKGPKQQACPTMTVCDRWLDDQGEMHHDRRTDHMFG